MKNIEILEINEIGDHEQGLSLLLEDSVNNGASIGFLAPIEKNEVVFAQPSRSNVRPISSGLCLRIKLKYWLIAFSFIVLDKY